MGRRGPKRKPTAKRKLEGGRVSHRKKNRKEPMPELATGVQCPEWLDDNAKLCWFDLTPKLEDEGLLTVLDIKQIIRYCQTWSRWVMAEQFCQEHGDVYPLYGETKKPVKYRGKVQSDDKGKPIYEVQNYIKCFQQVPHRGIANRLNLALCRIEAQFGMTPSSRTGIEVAKGKDKGKGGRADWTKQFLGGDEESKEKKVS